MYKTRTDDFICVPKKMLSLELPARGVRCFSYTRMASGCYGAELRTRLWSERGHPTSTKACSKFSLRCSLRFVSPDFFPALRSRWRKWHIRAEELEFSCIFGLGIYVTLHASTWHHLMSPEKVSYLPSRRATSENVIIYNVASLHLEWL